MINPFKKPTTQAPATGQPPADPRKAIFAKLATAKTFGSRKPRIRDGGYLLAVEKFEVDWKEKGFMCIVEFRVLESYKVNAYDLALIPGTNPPAYREVPIDVSPNPPGTSVGWASNLTSNVASASNVKAFVCELLGVDPQTITDVVDPATGKSGLDELQETFELATSPAQPFRGMVARMETYRKPQKSNPGKIFLGFNWAHVEQGPEDVARVLALLGSSPSAGDGGDDQAGE